MQIFFIPRRILLSILLVILTGIGFWSSRSFLQHPENKEVAKIIADSKEQAAEIPAMIPTKNKKKVIFGIDSGHGGIDSGTKWENLLEKNLNLNFSQKLAEGFKKRGYQVVLTRDKDQLLTPLAHYSNKTCPYKRDDLIRRIQKLEAAKVSTILCIHANWNTLAYHRGPTVYFSVDSPESQKIARHVQEQLNRIQPFRKLPKPSNYYILQQVRKPAILVELGFFSNRIDRNLLQDDNYLEQLKAALIKGLEATL